jgi:hypothetical protein
MVVVGRACAFIKLNDSSASVRHRLGALADDPSAAQDWIDWRAKPLM